MIFFGLTGGIACGKSTVARAIADQGVPVVDADLVAREVVAPGTDGLAAIVERFGLDVLGANGELDRKKLGALVFADPSARAALNAITHPRIAERTVARRAELEAAGHPVACYEAALLVENGIAEAFRPLVVVALPRAAQLARLVARDRISEVEAAQRLDAQLPLEKKIAIADHVIWNDGDASELPDKVRPILDAIRRLAPAAT